MNWRKEKSWKKYCDNHKSIHKISELQKANKRINNCVVNFKIVKENILFIDIETVPLQKNFAELSADEQHLFEEKTAYQRKSKNDDGEITPEDFYEKAGIWAEFGKVICISVGYFKDNEFRLKSFFSDDETKILKNFKALLDDYFYKSHQLLCGHNIKEFDIPFLARRMVIAGIDLPKKINLFGKKPWEVPHIDTMHLWRFGDYKHYTSLNLLTNILGIPSPKNDDIDGSKVAAYYYEKKDLESIAQYCERDVVAVAKVFLRLNNQNLEDIDFLI